MSFAFSDTIRYLSTHDNKYLRYFRGHSEKVVDLAINPQNDTFLSSSMDQTVQMWDLRSQKSQVRGQYEESLHFPELFR